MSILKEFKNKLNKGEKVEVAPEDKDELVTWITLKEGLSALVIEAEIRKRDWWLKIRTKYNLDPDKNYNLDFKDNKYYLYLIEEKTEKPSGIIPVVKDFFTPKNFYAKK